MTEYKKQLVKLSFNQRNKLIKAIKDKSPFTLRLKASDLNGKDELQLNNTQINRINKAKRLNKGVDIDFSKTHVSKLRLVNGSGVQNRPSPKSQPTKGRGIRNRPFNINDYAQFQPPPLIGSWNKKKKL